MKANLENFCVVLNEPRYPENIGAAARCCRNMGIPQLRVVRPFRLDREKMLKMATHEAADLIDNLDLYDRLEDAIAPFAHVVGTTARIGRHRQPTDTPRTMVRRLVPLSAHNQVALLFGSEKWGLDNHALHLCQSLVHIPTAAFSSINLAQSVMIICYELSCAGPDEAPPQPRLATAMELEGMYGHLQEVFSSIGFIRADAPEYWMSNVRHFLGRIGLQAKEVKLIRGFCRQMLWAVKARNDARS